MKFNSLGFGTAVATAVVAGSIIAPSSAEAAQLTGNFDINLNGSVIAMDLGLIDFKSNFNNNFISGNRVDGTGDFANYSSFKIKDLNAALLSGPGSIGSFITFRSTNPALADITLDLLELPTYRFEDNGGTKSTTATLAGILKRAGNDDTPLNLEISFITAFLQSNGNSTGSINAVAVPTPALLPGLIGMGVAALRKRGEESAEDAEA